MLGDTTIGIDHSQRLGGGRQIVPGPLVGRILDAGGIKEILVVVEDVEADVAREAVDAAVIRGRFEQRRPVVVQVVAGLFDLRIQVLQHAFGRVARRRPEEEHVGNQRLNRRWPRAPASW